MSWKQIRLKQERRGVLEQKRDRCRSAEGRHLFYIIGKSFGIPYDIKSPPGGSHSGGVEDGCRGSPAAGGESCAQDSFYLKKVLWTSLDKIKGSGGRKEIGIPPLT